MAVQSDNALKDEVLIVKDFIWGTLNDPEVRPKIEEAYPDIRETGLYKSRSA